MWVLDWFTTKFILTELTSIFSSLALIVVITTINGKLERIKVNEKSENSLK